MRKVINYDENYCIRLIQSALLPNGKNGEINNSSIKKHILEKLQSIQEQYGMTCEDICSEICFHFMQKNVITKINSDKGCPTTFILHYVFNQLRNIERSCSRGNFENPRKKRDAMSKVTCDLEVMEDKIGPKIWAEPVDPESILLFKELIDQLLSELGAQELSLLIGQISMEEYCHSTGSSRRSAFRRLACMRLRVRELLVTGSG